MNQIRVVLGAGLLRRYSSSTFTSRSRAQNAARAVVGSIVSRPGVPGIICKNDANCGRKIARYRRCVTQKATEVAGKHSKARFSLSCVVEVPLTSFPPGTLIHKLVKPDFQEATEHTVSLNVWAKVKLRDPPPYER